MTNIQKNLLRNNFQLFLNRLFRTIPQEKIINTYHGNLKTAPETAYAWV